MREVDVIVLRTGVSKNGYSYTPGMAEALLPPGTGIVFWLPLAGACNVAVNLDWLEW